MLSRWTSDILENGGNIFDATIATLFCNGVATFQSMGLGGGFLMNIYVHAERKSYSINSKEVAPMSATPDMYKTEEEYKDSGLAIGVPGEVKGYWEVHKRFGSMPWKSLIEPTIKVCEEGLTISKHVSDNISPRLLKDNRWK